MSRVLATLLLLAVLVLSTGPAVAADPPTAADYAPITLHVACGEVFGAPCAKVLPRIAARTAPTGIILRPVESGAALDPVAAVCQGQAAAAIVPADELAQLSHQPACLGRFDLVGRPLYPLYALLVVRAGAAFRSLDDVASEGRHATIAAGPGGTGTRVTLDALLRSDPAWHKAITVTDHDASSVAPRIADGTIDGFFVVDSLDSALIAQLRMSTDARGEPFYRFIDIRPVPEFMREGDGGGRCIYRLTALDFGDASPVTTVSIDAVMILSRALREVHARGGPFAGDALASAIDATRAAILGDMKAPGDWRPAGASCQ